MITDIEKLIEHICGELKKEMDVAVVGTSGGADSTLVAILCSIALGKDNVYTLHMPMNDIDETTFNAQSLQIATHLGLNKVVVPISGAATSIINGLQAGFDEPLSTVNAGNARSRARMCMLYGASHLLATRTEQRVRVIGTGNLSEDFIGYATLGGDMACDFFPIGDLYKSEVYQLLNYFRDQGLIKEEHINRVPSAGLWNGQTDEEELGHTYNDMEPSIERLRKLSKDSIKSIACGRTLKLNGQELTKLDRFVAKRYITNVHKLEAPPKISLRDKF